MSLLPFPSLGAAFRYGYLGTYVFLIVSGYTIISSAQNKSILQFIFGRFLRIYPSYLAAVCLTALSAQFWGGDRYHVGLLQFLTNLTFLNELIGIESVDSVYWFMLVVLRFYFIIAILIGMRMMRFYKLAAGLWLLLSMIMNFYPIPKLGFVLIQEHSAFLISGMILYAVKKEGWGLYTFIILLASIIFGLHKIGQGIPAFNNHYGVDLSIVTAYTITLAAYSVMLHVILYRKQGRPWSGMATAGLCTYPLFLIHQHIGFMLFNSYGVGENKYVLLVITLWLMLLLSFVIVKYIEPCLSKGLSIIIRRPWFLKSGHAQQLA